MKNKTGQETQVPVFGSPEAEIYFAELNRKRTERASFWKSFRAEGIETLRCLLIVIAILIALIGLIGGLYVVFNLDPKVERLQKAAAEKENQITELADENAELWEKYHNQQAMISDLSERLKRLEPEKNEVATNRNPPELWQGFTCTNTQLEIVTNQVDFPKSEAGFQIQYLRRF